MNLLMEILSEEGAECQRAYVIVPDFCAYFKSVKGVAEYSSEKIIVNLHKAKVTIQGEKLYIGKFFEGDLLIYGKVRSTFYE
jgi:hypothetical protein